MSRIVNEASEGRGRRTLLDVALQIKADALSQLTGDLSQHQKFLQACDTVADSVKERPDLTIDDYIKEQEAKKKKLK